MGRPNRSSQLGSGRPIGFSASTNQATKTANLIHGAIVSRRRGTNRSVGGTWAPLVECLSTMTNSKAQTERKSEREKGPTPPFLFLRAETAESARWPAPSA